MEQFLSIFPKHWCIECPLLDAIVSYREPPDIHLNPQKAIVNEEAQCST